MNIVRHVTTGEGFAWLPRWRSLPGYTTSSEEQRVYVVLQGRITDDFKRSAQRFTAAYQSGVHLQGQV